MPDNADAWIVLGHAEFRLGFEHHSVKPRSYYEASKRAYRVAAKLKGDVKTWINLGDVCMYSGDFEGEFAAFKAALEIDPDHPWALWHLGRVHAERGEHRDAIAFFRQSINRLTEGAAWVYVDLGMSEIRLGNKAEAIDAFLQAVVLDNGVSFDTFYPQIAVSFYGHDQAAVELRDCLSEINLRLSARFFAYFEPHVGTVSYAKGYYRIKTDPNHGTNYGDYFILAQEIEAAGIPKLRIGDRVEFKTDVGRRVLAKHFKMLPR